MADKRARRKENRGAAAQAVPDAGIQGVNGSPAPQGAVPQSGAAGRASTCKADRRSLLRNLAGEICVFGLLHMLLAQPLYAVGGNTLLYGSLLLLLPAIGLAAARAYVHNPALALLCHLALCVLPLLLPVGAGARLLFFILLWVLGLWSFRLRLGRRWWQPHVGFMYFYLGVDIAATAIGVFVAGQLGLPLGGAWPLMAAWALVVAALALGTASTAALDTSLRVQSPSTVQPLGEIRRFNNRLLAGIGGLFGLGLLLALAQPFSRVLPGLGRALLAALQALFGRGGDEGAAELPPVANAPQPAGEIPLPEAAPPNPILVMLWRILGGLLLAALAAGLLAALAFAAFRLYRHMAGGVLLRQGQDEKQYIGPALKAEALAKPFARLLQSLPRFGKTEAERIRRRYYKTVRRAMQRGAKVLPTHTPADIEATLAAQPGMEGSEAAQLTESYEKARYGEKEG